ncbi:MAG: hypothetical protein PWQ84_883 [Thermotogaceae bacterium]|nr:hypothetical protein [Thermotogaceae bacterium]
MERFVIQKKELLVFCQSIMLKKGCSSQEASDVAEVLVEADLRGIFSHGVARLRRYINHIDDGIIQVKTSPEVVRETENSMVIDGKSGVGQHVSKYAVHLLKKKTENSGIAICSVRNSNHYGIAGFYAEQLAKDNIIGVSLTNTSPLVVPTFSKKAVLGTNPIAVAIPLKNNMFLLDMATSIVSRGKIEVYNRRNQIIPTGWAVDEFGNVSRIPDKVLKAIKENKGGLLPLGGIGELFGGHKGYGLSFLVELLTKGLAESDMDQGLNTKKSGICHFFAAIQMELFGQPERIKKHLSEIVDKIVHSEKAEGQKKIYIHGEKEFLEKKKSEEEGIILDENTVELLFKLSREYGVTLHYQNDSAKNQ